MTHSEAIERLEAKVLKAWPPAKWQAMTIIVACSGGADSIAMLRSLCRLAPSSTTLVVAHFNHQLRGEASDTDELLFEVFRKS